uniref:Alpha/beta hydrolase fold-3 domain-containing protein n=1 Tax=Varanus komodoensis TaxID=61221 RepID=A0A8D2LMQ2_VARKO
MSFALQTSERYQGGEDCSSKHTDMTFLPPNLYICPQLKFMRLLSNGRKPGKDPTLFIRDVKLAHVSARIYQPKTPSAGRRKGIVYFHGGGWVIGSIREFLYRGPQTFSTGESESVVVSVDYRLAPEHIFPAPLNDCLAATTHFLETAEDYGVDRARVIVAGDSAGGNLAAMVAHTLASRPDLPKLRAQVLIYPVLQAVDFNLPSYQQNRAVPLLYREQAAFYVLQYLKGNAALLEEVLESSHVPVELRLHYRKWLSADHIPEEFKARGFKPPVVAACGDEVHEALKNLSCSESFPLLAEDAVLRLLPETFLLTCEYDVLRDDGLLYKKRLEENGRAVTWFHIANGFHGVISFFDSGWFSFPSGKKGMTEIVNFIKRL